MQKLFLSFFAGGLSVLLIGLGNQQNVPAAGAPVATTPVTESSQDTKNITVAHPTGRHELTYFDPAGDPLFTFGGDIIETDEDGTWRARDVTVHGHGEVSASFDSIQQPNRICLQLLP